MNITVFNSHIEISGYTKGKCNKLEKLLSQYDSCYHQYIPTGYIYDEGKRILYIPSGVELNTLVDLLELSSNDVIFDNSCSRFDTMSLRVNSKPRSELQVDSISFLVGEGRYRYTKSVSQLVLSLVTGEGKTFCAIVASVIYKMKTMIISHRTALKSQWFDAYTKFTDIDRDDIIDITNMGTVDTLMHSRKSHYKVFIISHDILHNMGEKYGVEYLNKFMTKMGIGLKIFDEAHREFRNILYVDMYTNVKKTIYLSATFYRTEYSENQVFQRCFKSVPKFIQGIKGYNDKLDHVVYLAYLYNTKPKEVDKHNCSSRMGFNGKAYGKYEEDKIDVILPHLTALIKKFCLNKDGYRTLVTISTIDGCDLYASELSKIFPGVNIKSYHSKKDKHSKELTLKYSKIIISTMQSLGEFVNITNLKYVINMESFSGKVFAKQMPGRLRKIDNNIKSLYIEMVDIGFKGIQHQYMSRQNVYKKLFGKLLKIKIK